MPWTIGDVEKHNKGLSDKRKAVWVKVANSCLASGDDDATAIRKANAAVKNVKEAFVFEIEGETYTATCIASDGNVEVDDLLPVQRVEEATLEGDVVQFREAKIGADGTVKLRLIVPGQGSTAFYPSEVLKRDAKVFRKGTHMYLDHATEQEEAARPEGSVKNLAAVLEEDAYFENHPTGGPGVYARAKVFSDYRQFLAERANDIGVSIRAMGKGRHGQVAGKATFIAEQLTAAKSVDFVTAAGAGGKLMSLYEAARNGRTTNKEQETMTDEEKKEMEKLQEAAKKIPVLEAENERLREALVTNAGRAVVTEVLAKSGLKDKAQERVRRIVGEDFPVTDKGVLDESKLRESVKKAVEEEQTYIKEFSEGGKIEGMGDGGKPKDEADAAKLKERQDKAYKVLSGK